MNYHPRKAALYRIAIEHGLQSPEELCKFLPLGSSVPQEKLSGWLHQFFRLPKKFSDRRRYVNRFKLGADPEFIFANCDRATDGRVIASARVDASAMGLAQGPAFGADNNGRLAEIRPYPSRSAVEVVASILCTLRWMVTQVPSIVSYEWLSGAYLLDDGLGGHVHFGRKRPNRKLEVEALDSIEEGLLYLGVYPKDQVDRRRAGDARRQIYGALGDFRLQQHGYEYRTFPSWLDSPELAFLTLVVSKLSVQMPDLYRFKGANPILEHARLRNFLAYFKGVDDDARLALLMLDRGLPTQRGDNFAPRWGIKKENAPKKLVRIPIIPPCIKPDAQSVQEVFESLQSGKPLGFRVPEVTWAPTAPPKGYRMCSEFVNTILAKGLGELVWDLCCHESQHIYFQAGRQGTYPLIIARDLLKRLPADWKRRFEGRASSSDLKANSVVIAPEWREGARAVHMKRLLLNGLFPVWRVRDCKENSFQLWQERTKLYTPTSAKLAGKIEYESQSAKAFLK